MAIGTTVIKDTKEITFTGSPQWITARDEYAAAPADNFYISLYVWSGDKVANKPATPTEQRFLPAIALDLGEFGFITEVSFEISKFLEAYIEQSIFKYPTAINYNDGAVWYSYKVSATGSGGGNIPFESDTKLAVQGRGTVRELSNPGTTVANENNKVFGNHSTDLIVNTNGNYSIPIYVGGASTNKALRVGSTGITLTSLGVTLGSADNDKQIVYLPINSTTFGGLWSEGKEIEYSIVSTTATTILDGIQTDGISTYYDLGTIPLLDVTDDYISVTMQTVAGTNVAPFGYQDGSPNVFSMISNAGDIDFRIQNATGQIEPRYTGYEDLHTVRFLYNGVDIEVEKDGVYLFDVTGITTRDFNTVGFTLGAMNNGGTKIYFSETVIVDVTHHSSATGVDTSYNVTNSWNGGTNYGAITVEGNQDDWHTKVETTYKIKVECAKGEPMVLKYLNTYGAIDTLPVNGSMRETFAVNKTNYSNSVLDTEYDYNPLSHVDKTFTSNGTVTMDISTGWISEEASQMVRELMVSNLVWLDVNGELYPIQINTKSVQIINRKWERTEAYNFSVTVATDYLNDIL